MLAKESRGIVRRSRPFSSHPPRRVDVFAPKKTTRAFTQVRPQIGPRLWRCVHIRCRDIRSPANIPGTCTVCAGATLTFTLFQAWRATRRSATVANGTADLDADHLARVTHGLAEVGQATARTTPYIEDPARRAVVPVGSRLAAGPLS